MLNLSPANLNDTEYNIYGTPILGNNKEGFSVKKSKNRTIKNKVEKRNMMEKMQELHEDMEDGNGIMENFESEQTDEGEPKNIEDNNEDEDEYESSGSEHEVEGDPSIENFANFQNNENINDFYKKTVPMYNQSSVQNMEKDELLRKLNYMIHLLEEQRNERTGYITEDLILYSFLGIFIIFVLDSFARVGKYVR